MNEGKGADVALEDSEAADKDDPHVTWVRARRKCTPGQRRWLNALPTYGMRYWSAGMALGHSTRTIHRWLRNENVKTALEARHALDEIHADVGRNRVLSNWEQQARADITLFYKTGTFDIKPPSEWTEEMRGMVQELSFDRNGKPKLKLYNRQDATNTLAKYNKMISDRHELMGPDGEPLSLAPPIVNVVISKDSEQSEG